MFKKVLIGLAGVIIVFAGVVALQPADYRVTRSISIAAPPSVAFAHVNNMKKLHAWCPWSKIDPAAKFTFQGPEEGVGSAQSWAGNSEAGEGCRTIVESRPNEFVEFKLDFFKPFAGTAEARFDFATKNGRTEVTWSMSGENNFVSKAMCMFVSLDKMIGGTFEKGLADLKAVSEAEAGTSKS